MTLDAAARAVGARAYVFTDHDYASETWRAKRGAFERALRGERPAIEFAWAARDVESFARNVSNVHAGRLREFGGVRGAVFPSIKMTEEWYGEARRQGLDIVPWIVDSEEDADVALRMRAKAVISNFPLKMRKIMRKKCRASARGARN